MSFYLSKERAARYGSKGGNAKSAVTLVHIEGQPYTIEGLAREYGVTRNTMAIRLKSITTRPTHEQLALWGQRWKWHDHTVRMGPSGWEVRYARTRVWVPYAGIGKPTGLEI